MNKEELDKLYNDIFDHFVALRDGIVEEVNVTFNEMKELDYVRPSYWGVIGYDGNCYGVGMNGMYNNYADVLRYFANKNNFIQTIDEINHQFVFYRGGSNE